MNCFLIQYNLFRISMYTLFLLFVFCATVTHACTNYGARDNVATSTGEDNGESPLILWWYEGLFPHMDDQDTYEFECPSGVTCTASKDRNLLHTDRDMTVMIYGTDFKIEDAPLPRKSNHQWALLHEESPQNNYVIQHQEAISLFNYTATFQRSSDYPLTTQYLPSLKYLTERKAIPINVKNNMRKNGFAPVLYLQSNCNVPSDRDRYIKELMDHIDVDSYGKCLNNIHFKNKKLEEAVVTMNDKELLKIISNYKFHIAFENAVCDDYITEKFYRPLHVGSVPVYYGSSTIRQWAPDDHSVIVASDYASPERLADYLHFLDENEEAYLNYLSYRETGITNKLLTKAVTSRDYGEGKEMDNFVPGFECYVCDHMVANKQDHKKGQPLHGKVASSDHLSCPMPFPSIGNKEDLLKSDDFNFWPEDYLQTLYSALALRDMVSTGEKDASKAHEYVERRMNLNRHQDL